MRHGKGIASLAGWRAVLLLLQLVAGATGWASGPRWVTGQGYFNPIAQPIIWYTDHPQYFTDAGDLSATVSHSTADAMVARAAGVWNVPTSRLVLSQGGTLAEHVSGGNVFASSKGLVFPADVQASNGQNVPIAVIYDSDGSVTDMLLGGGASDPTGCLQGGVTESVDSISPDGHIRHALLVLNGRCTGSLPEEQLQMQYQLERAFGRVLGLAWSQTNDNVFTGTPTPTYNQALHWPIMHPIDIICGPYTYQCLPQPFMLRPDDISSISHLYFIAQGQAPFGKVDTLSNGSQAYGTISFPNGTGMEGVNVVARRMEKYYNVPEPWETASGVTGFMFRRVGPSPLKVADPSWLANTGLLQQDFEGYYDIRLVPRMENADLNTVIVTTQPVNPLYIGPYALGAGTGDVMVPSGNPISTQQDYQGPYNQTRSDMTLRDAVNSCPSSGDGTEGAPTAVADGGWWSGTACGWGHVAWSTVPVKAGRTLTVEVTAMDELGNASTMKAMPAIGVWRSTDATGTLPTVAASSASFNATASGMTSIPVSLSAAQTLRLAVLDSRGSGRPDFAYTARVLYADAITPTAMAAAGGVVTITGRGFRQGNAVLVNGMAAAVTSWSANTIVATVPSVTALGSNQAITADVTIRDLTSGGTSTIKGALAYAAPLEALVGVSAPAGTVAIGLPATTAFAVKAIAPNGVSPEAGKLISFTAAGGAVRFGTCGGAAACTVVTNTAGVASTTVTAMTVGPVVLFAKGTMGTVTAAFTAGPAPPDTMLLVSAPTGTITVGAAAAVPFATRLVAGDGVTARVGQAVTLAAPGAVLSVCGGSTCAVTTDGQGMVSTMLTPTSAGTVTMRASATTASVSATVTAGVATMRLMTAPSGTATVGTVAGASFAVKVLAGDGTTPIAGEAIVFSALANGVRYGACGGTTCTVLTDAAGVATSTVTPLMAASVTMSAAGSTGSVTSVMVSGAETMQVLRAPAGIATVGKATGTALSLRVLAGDGVTPVAGELVGVTAVGGAVRLGGCGAAICSGVTDASGAVTMSVTPMAAGAVVLTATLPPSRSATSVSASFSAALETVHVVRAPTGTVMVGSAASGGFVVRLLEGDGGTPVAGETVVFSVVSGSAQMGSCGAVSCNVVTDATGTASVAVTPTMAGVVGLAAMTSAGTVSASFTATTPPDVQRTVSAPSGGAFVGETVVTLFAVQVVRADGVTPVVGTPVSFVVNRGSAVLGMCGTGSCTLLTDAHGLAQTTLTAMAPGVVTVMATSEAGVATATVAAVTRVRTITATRTALYVAEGATVVWSPQVVLADNEISGAETAVTWISGGMGMSIESASSLTDAWGAASTVATVGPLTAGMEVDGTACAPGGLCAGFAVYGVSQDAIRIEVVSGDGQTVAADGSLASAVLRVTDGIGNPVAGASVAVHQTVSAWQAACVEQGRCPLTAVLDRGVTTGVSDLDGLLTVTPMQVAGTPGRTQIAAAAGTQGFVTMSLETQP